MRRRYSEFFVFLIKGKGKWLIFGNFFIFFLKVMELGVWSLNTVSQSYPLPNKISWSPCKVFFTMLLDVRHTRQSSECVQVPRKIIVGMNKSNGTSQTPPPPAPAKKISKESPKFQNLFGFLKKINEPTIPKTHHHN